MLHFFAQLVRVTRNPEGRFHRNDKLFNQITIIILNNNNSPWLVPERG